MSQPGNHNMIRSGSLLFVSTVIVNLGNYGINLLLGRWMGPQEFSEIGLLVTLLLALSFVALAFQLTAARFMAALPAGDQPPAYAGTMPWLLRVGWVSGAVLAVLFLLLAYQCSAFFQVSSSWLFPVFGIGLPFYLALSVNRGILQGKGWYGKLALTYQVEMWTRLVLSIVAVKAGWGATGVAAAISVSILLSLLVSASEHRWKAGKHTANRTVLHFLLFIMAYECSQILINNCDVILVKHFYPPTEAGLYAALALIGRIVYFGTWTVVTLLFPTVIKLEKEGKPHLHYFAGGLAIVVLLAVAIIVMAYSFPSWMVNLLFGEAYLPVAPLLWRYALATALFACANVFVYYNISLERRLPVWIMMAAGALQIVLIWYWHDSFGQVIAIQVWLMLAVIVVMVLLQAWYEWQGRSRAGRTAMITHKHGL